MNAYPNGFQSWPLEQKNAYFARETKTYDEIKAKRDEPSAPIPLCAPVEQQQSYPVSALGPLAGAAEAIAHKVQAPICIAGQSVLAAASLGAQAIADVILPYGQSRPLSLNLITIADSGQRKTTVDNEATAPIRMREKRLRETYDAEIEIHRIAKAAWEGQKRKIENDKGLETVEARMSELKALGPEPRTPLLPILLAPEPTLEGLGKAWVHAPGSLGLFSAEGGQLTGGHGFSPDHRLKTAAGLSVLWDGGGMRRLRAGDGLVELRGRRLAAHILIQPGAGLTFLSDPILRDQGLLSRLLLAAPESIGGTRLYREPEVETDRRISKYTAKLLTLLESEWPCNESANELSPKQIPLTSTAKRVWINFYDNVERSVAKDAALFDIRDVAAKAAEQVARVAGVCAIYDNPGVEEIDEESVANACTLVTWHLNEANRLSRAAGLDPAIRKAKTLLEWMEAKGAPVSLREICNSGPNPTRKKSEAEKALEILRDHGWIDVEKGRSTIAVLKKEEQDDVHL